MNLVIIATCFVACFAAKLDRSYLPPDSASTAGGTADILQTPFDRAAIESIPAGGFVNEHQGVVIDVATGTRATGQTGLGGSRVSYGSTDSKVGDAAFIDTANENPESSGILNKVAGFRQPLNQVVARPGSQYQPDMNGPVLVAERFQASRDRGSNIVRYENDIGTKDFNYIYETDNGISAGSNGIATNGVRAQGGYSYTGDDGKVYSVSYVADERGFRPVGSHLPTPPPIPVEILKALEQNAKDEAAGIIEDGSYNAQKYNNIDNSRANSGNDMQSNKQENVAFNNAINPDTNKRVNSNQDFNNQNFIRNEDSTKPTYNPGQYEFNKINKYEKTNSVSDVAASQSQNEFHSATLNSGNGNRISSNAQTIETSTSPSSNRAYNADDKHTSSVPLSQQSLQQQKESEISLSGRPSSYDAPITGTVQPQTLANTNDNQKFLNRFGENPNIPELEKPFILDSALNPVIRPISRPFDSSISFTNSQFDASKNQYSQQSSTNNIISENSDTNQNNINKLSHISTSQQKTENHLQADAFFSHKQQSLMSHKQNTNVENTFVNSYQSNPTASIMKETNFGSTTYRPDSFNQYYSGQNQNNRFNQPMKPFNIHSSHISNLAPSTMVPSSQDDTFLQHMPQFVDTNNPGPPIPSPTLLTPKEDGPQSNNNVSNGLTQASISAFPSVAPGTFNSNKPFNSFDATNANNRFTSSQPMVGSFLNSNVNSFNTQSKFNQQSTVSGSMSTSSATPSQQYQGEIYEYNKPPQSFPSSSEQPNVSVPHMPTLNQQTGSNLHSPPLNYYSQIKQKQQSSLDVFKPQLQNSFSSHTTQSGGNTQFISMSNKNDIKVDIRNETSNEQVFGDMFRPKLLPSRPSQSSQSCCAGSANVEKKNSDFSFNRRINSAQNGFGENGSNRKENQQRQTSQAYDQSGYHY